MLDKEYDGRYALKLFSIVTAWWVISNVLLEAAWRMTIRISPKFETAAGQNAINGIWIVAGTVLTFGLFCLMVRLIDRDKYLDGLRQCIPVRKEDGKKMTVKVFLLSLCLLLTVKEQEGLINTLFGYGGGIMAPGEAGHGSRYLFLIGSLLVAPVMEELLFRGLICKNLRRYGKITAIVLSSFLFGFCHGSVAGGIMAGLSGLIFGYLATHYGIGWSMLFHGLYNCVTYLQDISGIQKPGELKTLTAGNVISNVCLLSMIISAVLFGAWLIKRMRSGKIILDEEMPELPDNDTGTGEYEISDKEIDMMIRKESESRFFENIRRINDARITLEGIELLFCLLIFLAGDYFTNVLMFAMSRV